jgi:hypothetical protein
LGSDKAHLTVLSGNKKAWPVYLSIGNIKSRVRNKLNSGAWVTIAHIPIVEFENDTNIRTTLQSRFFHQCMRIVIDSLIDAGKDGVHLTDAKGHVRNCFPRLAAYIADYPEQILVNVAALNNSPTSIAGYEELDNPTPLPPRTRNWIVQQIGRVTALVDPQAVEAYTNVAKKYGLNGVHKPFWIDLPNYEPENAIAPDILHGCLRFWRDHPLKWMRKLIGKEEFNRRLRSLQPVVGYRHFKSGINSLHQWTGRDDRELLRVALAVVAGAPAIDDDVIKALRGINDFIYLAQYRSHTDSTLSELDRSLGEFHDLKDVFIQNGARKHKKRQVDGFKIPKLSALGQYSRFVTELGSCPQFSTEIVERCHQPMLKDAYRATNRRDFAWQMCRYLNRREHAEHFQEFLNWATTCPVEALSSTSDYTQMVDAFPSQPLSLHQSRSRITLLKTPPIRNRTAETIATSYRLRDLNAAIADYMELVNNPTLRRSSHRRASLNVRIPACTMDVWHRLRIHLGTTQGEDEEILSHVVQALPPSESLPYGRCDAVLVHEGRDTPDIGLQGEANQFARVSAI